MDFEQTQVLGHLDAAVFRLALGEGVARRVVGVAQMVDVGQQRSELGAVVGEEMPTEMPPKSMPAPALAADQKAGLNRPLDGSFVVDAALFRTDWKGIQVLEVINNTGVNGNAGDATSQGFEWSTTWIPLHGLTLMFSGAWATRRR